MFRNRSFRTKLALAITPPLLVLIALVATVVRPRLDEAADAAHKKDQAALAATNMQLRDELLLERDATIQKITSRPGLHIDVAEVRSTTNKKRIALRAAMRAFSSRDNDERRALGEVERALTELETLRSAIDTGTFGPLQIHETYEHLIELHLGISKVIVRTSNDTNLLRQASANLDYLQYRNAVARANSYIGLRVESGTLTQTDLLRVSADLAVAGEFRAQFLQSGSDAAVALDQQVNSSAEVAAAIAMRDEILLAGSRNRTPAVSPAAWWDAARAQLAAMGAVENRSFDDFVLTADTLENDARRDSTLYLSVLGIGVILAALAALAFGRSIAARIAKVSADAHEIASVRLPEVLDALRNPSPEVLAQSLPQVHADSTDEIGSLAASFNTVLRTSVETSIAHAQRRSRTLTNILVNLGRRNQSLIDRQLELVDELESTQRDPEVLRGLFQLDHMITSLRRNAENLLVLASDSQARAWSAPVSMVDVVRGAVAEVEDMSRIELELDLTDNSTIGGRYAVDLSHLVAELVDNALAFSPPTASVHLRSERTAQQFRIWILDSGLGMSEAELSSANQHVTNPPDVDELTADRIGFQVVGRLAIRLGVAVRLQPNPGGGLAASVTVPVALLEAVPEDFPPVPRPPLRLASTDLSTTRPAAVTEPSPVLRPNWLDAAPGAPGAADAADSEPASGRDAPVRIAARSVPVPVGAAATATAESPTSNGLQRRVPGQAFDGDAKARQFDSGQFRRLPMPGDRSNPTDDVTVAERRLNALSGLQSGAGRARDEHPADEL